MSAAESQRKSPAGSSSGAANANGATKHTKPDLAATVKTAQFAWFVGQVVTLISIMFYSLTYVGIGKKLYRVWYDLALVGIVETFSILVYQTVQKRGVNVDVLSKDDNVHYLILGIFWLILRPNVFIVLLPFGIYSVFHVLAYVNGYILPLYNLENSQISSKLAAFINNNNVKSVQIGSAIELYSLIWLFLRVITIRKRSLVPFLVYIIFIKTRYEKIVFTRNHFKQLEIQIDKYVNQINVPVVKDSWIQFKQVLNKVGQFHIVNDYTKEKAN
jgi:hypothetical protein